MRREVHCQRKGGDVALGCRRWLAKGESSANALLIWGTLAEQVGAAVWREGDLTAARMEE